MPPINGEDTYVEIVAVSAVGPDSLRTMIRDRSQRLRVFSPETHLFLVLHVQLVFYGEPYARSKPVPPVLCILYVFQGVQTYLICTIAIA
jgi:hypothetical protein